MKKVFQFCLIVNMIFFLFGFILIGTNVTGIERVIVDNEVIELKFDYNNLIMSIVIIGILIALAGLQILGSGLQNTSVTIIRDILLYLLLWSILSLFSYDLIVLLPVGIGTIIYSLLTIMYAVSFIGIQIEGKTT